MHLLKIFNKIKKIEPYSISWNNFKEPMKVFRIKYSRGWPGIKLGNALIQNTCYRSKKFYVPYFRYMTNVFYLYALLDTNGQPCIACLPWTNFLNFLRCHEYSLFWIGNFLFGIGCIWFYSIFFKSTYQIG